MWVKIVLLLSVVANLILGYLAIKPKEATVRVVRVIDGDTFVLESQQEVRLATVDAPEIGLCGGKEARNKLEELVLNKKVSLKGSVNDKFGRLLASVYVGDLLVNEEIARSGWVRYTSQMSNGREKIKLAGEEARDKKRGIYGKCIEDINKTDPKCNIKGNVKDGVKTYMYPGCGTYSSVKVELDLGDGWFCTEKEAMVAGFVKGKNCNTNLRI